MNKLEELFAELYTEPESPQILGSILQDDVILKEEEVEPCQKIQKSKSLRRQLHQIYVIFQI